MSENEIKKQLLDQGLKVADIARAMSAEFGVSADSCDVMLRQLIAGQRWYPKYAEWLQLNYSITINKPLWALPVRERMKLQAA